MTSTRSRIATLIPCALLAACGSPEPVEPDDVDLSTARAGFRCGDAAHADAEACRVLDAFAAAHAVDAWPAASAVETWLGVDHCVQATTSGTAAAYQLVYLRAGGGSAPLGTVDPARVVPYAATFGSTQIQTDSMPVEAAALAAIARGQTPVATGEMWRVIPEGDGDAYRTLVRTRSGTSIGDGPVGTGIWFLRSDGTHLYLVGPTIQGGCASELFRVTR